MTFYRIEVLGLFLPRLNEVKRWHRMKQAAEVKRVRANVYGCAAADGLASAAPLVRAHVTITAWGPYERRDADGTFFKDVLDAIVARQEHYGQVNGKRIKLPAPFRRWGLVIDDSPSVIGRPLFRVRQAEIPSVIITVEDR